jgi:hypothetical protein
MEALYLLMKPRFSIPPIPEAERTPLVKALLGVIEGLSEVVQRQAEQGYRDVIIQDLLIEAHNTRYRLARWLTPKGEYLSGELPAHLADHHFGPRLRSYLLYQHLSQALTQSAAEQSATLY